MVQKWKKNDKINLGYPFWLVIWHVEWKILWIENSVDPGSHKPAELDLHCFNTDYS